MDMIFMNLEKKLTLGVILTLPWGLIHVYEHYNQRNLLVYISGERLQDHWSSGYRTLPIMMIFSSKPHDQAVD